MDKLQVAQELRQRQYATGLIPRRLIDEISDDQMIDSYTTCSCCGERQVTAQELETVIRLATDANHFIDLCDGFALTRHLKAYSRTTRRFVGKAKTGGVAE
jgi:hypothetical protein